MCIVSDQTTRLYRDSLEEAVVRFQLPLVGQHQWLTSLSLDGALRPHFVLTIDVIVLPIASQGARHEIGSTTTVAMVSTGDPLPAASRCRVCETDKALSLCNGCQVVYYCGRDHQTSDWPKHKRVCSPIKKTRTKLNAEVEKLNSKPESWMFKARPFENAVAHFWGILDTRDYMRARYAHVEALLEVQTRTAVEKALEHLLDRLRLNRSDNMGVRDLVPSLYLRLGRDQECYDFLKWWYTGTDSRYDWGNTSLLYLNIKDADAFEFHDSYCKKSFKHPHHAMCLLKRRLVFDIQALKNASTAVGDKLPQELIDEVRSHMVSSPARILSCCATSRMARTWLRTRSNWSRDREDVDGCVDAERVLLGSGREAGKAS